MTGVEVGGPGTLKLFSGCPWPRLGASTDRPGAYVTDGLLKGLFFNYQKSYPSE